MMKRILLLGCSLLLAGTAFAANNDKPILNRVVLRLQAEQWVTTDSAKVRVAINAALNKGQLVTAHQKIQQKLLHLSAKGAWHITSFHRTKDRSGLEQLQVIAEARLPESALAGLRDKAKAISQPGFSFTIANIDFVPNLTAFEKVRAKLRSRIYAEARTELQRLNKVYPEQHYVMHSIDFIGNLLPEFSGQPNVALAAYKARGAAPALTVSNKERISAVVVLASRLPG